MRSVRDPARAVAQSACSPPCCSACSLLCLFARLLVLTAPTCVLLCSYLIRHPAASWNDIPDLPKAAKQLLDAQFAKFVTRCAPEPTGRKHQRSPSILSCHSSGPAGSRYSSAWTISVVLSCPSRVLRCQTSRHVLPAQQCVIASTVSSCLSRVLRCQTSSDGETTKLLIALQDGQQVESVIMHYDTRGMPHTHTQTHMHTHTVLISGQALGGTVC